MIPADFKRLSHRRGPTYPTSGCWRSSLVVGRELFQGQREQQEDVRSAGRSCAVVGGDWNMRRGVRCIRKRGKCWHSFKRMNWDLYTIAGIKIIPDFFNFFLPSSLYKV